MKSPIFISNPLYDEIANKIKESYPKSCILFIDEIINSELQTEYQAQKQAMEETGEQIREELLFHGTRADLIDIIAEEGFDPTKNIIGSYGIGTYFAKNANYSMNYMKSKDKHGISYMFLATVLFNKIEKGFRGKISNQSILVDDIKNPTIFVSQYRYGAYPKYVIAFHKEAR